MKRYIPLLSTAIVAYGLIGPAWAAAGPAVTPAQISAAKTAADHEALAKAYEEEATDLLAKAEMHQQMADTYKLGGKPAFVGPTKHCQALAKDFKAAAAESRALAVEHHKMAEAAK